MEKLILKILLQDMAHRLVGQRIVPEMPDNFKWPILMIRLLRGERDELSCPSRRWMEFRTESNRINDEQVAFSLLHFFSHIDGASFDRVVARMHDYEQQPVNQPLNPLIFELLNEDRAVHGETPFRIYARTFILSSPDMPTRTQEDEVRITWRGIFGQRPTLELYGTNGLELVPWGVL